MGPPPIELLASDPGIRTIGQVRAEARAGALTSRIHAQIEELTRKDAANGKPYWEIRLRDASDWISLKAWNDSPNFLLCEELARGEAVAVEGDFSLGAFGLDARRWTVRPLAAAEMERLLAGDEAAQAARQRDFEAVAAAVESLADPRLRALGQTFLEDFGPRFRRAAAARQYHHACRGGLLRHVAQMLAGAEALCAAYPQLNRDLLITGVLFHDCGKLWEMCPPETGFEIARELRGELLGHITIGIEAVNALWRKIPQDGWESLNPSSEEVRLHLLHLIASHHGSLEFGSPVEPKTPEAFALHCLDNLDARLEMLSAAYDRQPEIAPGIFEHVRSLRCSPVRPLPRFE